MVGLCAQAGICPGWYICPGRCMSRVVYVLSGIHLQDGMIMSVPLCSLCACPSDCVTFCLPIFQLIIMSRCLRPNGRACLFVCMFACLCPCFCHLKVRSRGVAASDDGLTIYSQCVTRQLYLTSSALLAGVELLSTSNDLISRALSVQIAMFGCLLLRPILL